MTVRSILADGGRLYWLLLRRSVAVAAVVYAVIAALEFGAASAHWLSIALWPLRQIASLGGPLLVEGALIPAFAWATVTAPFSAHVLAVVYYRLADPERPVIHEEVGRWRSVWAGA